MITFPLKCNNTNVNNNWGSEMKFMSYRIGLSIFVCLAFNGCSLSESRENIPAMNGLYRCAITSTEPVGTERIPPGTRFYRYFNVNVNGESQRSAIYHPYPNDSGYENRTAIQWLSGESHSVNDASGGLFATVRAYDEQNVCFFINVGNEDREGNSVIDGRRVCALRLSPGSGVYSSNIGLIPEQGVCERIAD